MKNNIVIYQSGEIEIRVSIRNETIWLRQDEIAALFQKDRTVITRHINNILKNKEVNEKSNVQKMHFPNSDKPVKVYSLDIILAVGYRTNSAKAIIFRQWASKILKRYILDSYVINSERITHQRFKELETDVANLKLKVNDISNFLKDSSPNIKQGIFFDGQIFDPYLFVSGLIKRAKKKIILIDNYIDETVFALFSKNQNIDITVYSKNITERLKLDLKKYNSQYRPISLKKFNSSHDRFLIIDDKTIYHFGASLKDLGKKWFAFSKFDMDVMTVLRKLK